MKTIQDTELIITQNKKIYHLNLDKEQIADDIISISKSYNIDAQIIGRVQQCQSGKKLTISSKFGTFEY